MLTRAYYKRTYNAGMEVFTIGGHGSCCRTIEDPPYPIIMPQEAYFERSVYWHIKSELLQTAPTTRLPTLQFRRGKVCFQISCRVAIG